jgi:hypothetical protein
LSRIAAVAAIIALGGLVVLTISVAFHNVSTTDLKSVESLPSSLNSKALGLKEADIRLLQVGCPISVQCAFLDVLKKTSFPLQAAIHAQKSKDVKTCGLGCGGNDADCVALCGRPDGKGHAPLPAKTFKKLLKLTNKAAAVRWHFIQVIHARIARFQTLQFRDIPSLLLSLSALVGCTDYS